MDSLYLARIRKRKSQLDVAIRCGFSQPKYSLIERGYVCPNEAEKSLIANALEIEAASIIWPSPLIEEEN